MKWCWLLHKKRTSFGNDVNWFLSQLKLESCFSFPILRGKLCNNKSIRTWGDTRVMCCSIFHTGQFKRIKRQTMNMFISFVFRTKHTVWFHITHVPPVWCSTVTHTVLYASVYMWLFISDAQWIKNKSSLISLQSVPETCWTHHKTLASPWLHCAKPTQ